MTDVDLSTKLGPIELENPIILASGPLGGSASALRKYAAAGFGAVISVSISLLPCEGHSQPTMADIKPFYVINAVGGHNDGSDAWKQQLAQARHDGVPLLASIVGAAPGEYAEVAARMESAGADGVELNVSCSHSAKAEVRWSKDVARLGNVVTTVRKSVGIPVWVKLPSARMADVPRLAETSESVGANAIVPFNTVPSFLVDTKTGRPLMGNPAGIGSISGPCVKPLGLRTTIDTVRVVSIPVIGNGGISCGLDIAEYLMCGAAAVQIYTVVMREGAKVVNRLISELKQFMTGSGYTSLADFRGLTLKYLPKMPYQYEADY